MKSDAEKELDAILAAKFVGKEKLKGEALGIMGIPVFQLGLIYTLVFIY